MQIAVLSDIHLGVKDELDQFYRNDGAEEQLNYLLSYLENQVDKIVLLGDIFETLRGRQYSKQKRLVKILEAYPVLTANIIENPKYELIQGNHDFITGKLLNAQESLILNEDNVKMAFFHGHQVDGIVEDFWTRNFEKIGVWLGGWCERFGLDITKSGNLRSKFKALNNEWKVGAFEKACATLGNSMGCDIVVTGHSHHPMKVEIDDTLFLNSGTRVAARQDLIIIDTNSKQYEVYKKFDPRSQSTPWFHR